MQNNKTPFFSGFFLCFILFFWGTSSVSFANFTCENNADNPYIQKFEEYYSESHSFSVSFPLLKKDYHATINSEFNTAVADLSRSVYSGDSEEKACAPIQYTQKNNTSFFEFSSKIREEHLKYECSLRHLVGKYTKIEQKDQVSLFSEGISFMQNNEYQIIDEMRKSEIALHLSLQMYSEMRQWYPVHRDLECLISEMEKYRNAIRGFIDKVSIIPAKYYNYGSEKQQ